MEMEKFTIDRSRYDDFSNVKNKFESPEGLSEKLVRFISKEKNEPEWMLQKRLRGLKLFLEKEIPTWGPDLSKLDLGKIKYYVNPDTEEKTNWEDVPEEIRKVAEKIGIPEAEKKSLGGVGFQFDSMSAYHNLMDNLKEQGVIFENMDTALKKYPELVKKYFMTSCIPINDHKFIMLHTAVWSGGCLTGDSQIFTPNPGIKRISEIEEGSYVFTIDGKNKLVKSRVLAKIYNGKKKTYSIRVAGRTLNSTGNHKFLCLEKSDKKLNSRGKRWFQKWRELDEIQIGDFMAVTKKIPDTGISRELPELQSYIKNKRHENNLTVPKKTNDDLMWFFGLYLGDGNIYFPTEHMCFINLAIPGDSGLRKETENKIKSLFSYDIKTSNERSITINSKSLGNWLKELGFLGRAKEKRIPSWVFGLPLSERMEFLAGLLDSDGCVEVRSNSIRFELANKKLIEDIKLLSVSCGLYSDGKILSRKKGPSYSKKLNRTIKEGTSYICRISGRVKEIKSRDPNKLEKLDKIKKFTFDKYDASSGENFTYMTNEYIGFAPLREKKSIGIKDVYDIQVEGNHNFVANGIIAHNSFIYVPPNVKVRIPLQAYFRMNAMKGGQFEHTLIIADKNSEISYIEGCSSPLYNENNLHAGCVEIHVMEGARVRYSSVENWSKNTFNLNTKRAIVQKNGIIEWINGNAGSNCTMLYPCSVLVGEGARSDALGIAFAGPDQNQDTGSKVIHAAPNTSSTIRAKSISKGGGISSYRGLVKVNKNAKNTKCSVECDALLIDDKSVSNTYPVMKIDANKVDIAHEASVGKIGDEEIFYLMSRGLSEEQAMQMVVSGFIEPIVKKLPLEYAVELNKLIELEMEGTVG